MAINRKLGRPTDQRLAILKNQTTDLILHGKIETTEARAKEVKSIVDSIIALAIKEKDNFEEVEVKEEVQTSQVAEENEVALEEAKPENENLVEAEKVAENDV